MLRVADTDGQHKPHARSSRCLSQVRSCGYPEAGVIEHTTKLVEIDEKVVVDAVATAVKDESVVREVVEGESVLFLQSLYRAEVGLARSVHRIASAARHPLPTINVEKAIEWVEG